MSSVPIKKVLHALSVKKKLEIIDGINSSSDSRKNIAQQFNIPLSTLGGVIKQSESLRGIASDNPLLLKAKRLKKPRDKT